MHANSMQKTLYTEQFKTIPPIVLGVCRKILLIGWFQLWETGVRELKSHIETCKFILWTRLSCKMFLSHWDLFNWCARSMYTIYIKRTNRKKRFYLLVRSKYSFVTSLTFFRYICEIFFIQIVSLHFQAHFRFLKSPCKAVVAVSQNSNRHSELAWGHARVNFEHWAWDRFTVLY